MEYWYLVKQLVKSDLKVKYKGSVLGIFWSLLEPLSRFIIMFFVFSYIFKSGIPRYPLYLFSGIVVWNFFENSTRGSTNRIISNANLIKKVNFPRELLILSGVISSSINFLIELVPVAFIAAYYHIFPGLGILLFFPFFAIFFILNLGFGFFLGSTNVYMKDIQYIWSVLLQVGFFATPIFYELSTFPKTAQYVITANPVTGLVNFFRQAVIYGTSIPLISFGYSCIFSVFILIAGYLTFKHLKGGFAEEV